MPVSEISPLNVVQIDLMVDENEHVPFNFFILLS